MNNTDTKREPCRRCSAMGFLLSGKNSRTCVSCKGKGYLDAEDVKQLDQFFFGATRPLPRRQRL